MHGYIFNTIFLLKPSNLDEVCVQATYIETGKQGGGVSVEDIQSKDNKGKGKEKPKRTTFVKKSDDTPFFAYSKKECHDDDRCW